MFVADYYCSLPKCTGVKTITITVDEEFSSLCVSAEKPLVGFVAWPHHRITFNLVVFCHAVHPTSPFKVLFITISVVVLVVVDDDDDEKL